MNQNIYFGGGSFGCIYHIGVVRALYEANQTNLTVYANSAGALIATFYVCQIPTGEMSQIFANVATNAMAKITENPGKLGSYQLTQHHLDVFDRIQSRTRRIQTMFRQIENRYQFGRIRIPMERYIHIQRGLISHIIVFVSRAIFV